MQSDLNLREDLVQGTLVKDFLTDLARVQRASISKAAKSPVEHCSLSLSILQVQQLNYCRCQADSKASCSLLSPQLLFSLLFAFPSPLLWLLFPHSPPTRLFQFQAHVSSFLHFFFSDLLRCCSSLLFIRCSSIAIKMRY